MTRREWLAIEQELDGQDRARRSWAGLAVVSDVGDGGVGETET